MFFAGASDRVGTAGCDRLCDDDFGWRSADGVSRGTDCSGFGCMLWSFGWDRLGQTQPEFKTKLPKMWSASRLLVADGRDNDVDGCDSVVADSKIGCS